MNRSLLCSSIVLGLSQVGLAQSARLTHGPILGRPGSDGMRVWIRTSRPSPFHVRFGHTGRNLTQRSAIARTVLANDNTGSVRLGGLEPNTRYRYQVVVDGEPVAGPAGRGTFRTLPSPDQYRHAELNPDGRFNFSFEFACGNNQNPTQGIGPSLPTFRTMLDHIKDDIHFAILNGDWIYEEEREYTVSQWRRQVGISANETPRVVRVAPTLVGVWENYKRYLSRGVNLAEWHRHVPSLFTYDDHEILNDVWGTGTPGLRDRRAAFRDIGVQAWYDYLGWSNPVAFTQPIVFGNASLQAGSDVLIDSQTDFTQVDFEQTGTLLVHWGGPTAGVNDNALDGVGGDPNAGVYEVVEVLDRHQLRIRPAARAGGTVAYSIGRRSYYRFRVANCDFFVLDTRGHRQMHDTRHPDKPGLSMLGPKQKQWLMRGMRRSDADFLFVVSSVNLMIPHIGGGAVRADNKDDAWTVFFDEREQLIRFWDSLGKRVFVLTGDLHNSFVIRITDRVWEFASGPHNSQNHLVSDEGGRPANGRFKYGPRECDIRWSTSFAADIPRTALKHPSYCVVQVNNVYDNPLEIGQPRWVAFPRPQVIFRYFNGLTGQLRYAETLLAEPRR